MPVFRLGEIYLMKAELRLRKGDAAGALEYVNRLRNRAGAAPLSELTMESLSDEYARELFAEGKRRTQLIRFGHYNDARWEKPDVSPDYTTIWPIPQEQINLNPNLIQNPGY
jgi:hypothetical protein